MEQPPPSTAIPTTTTTTTYPDSVDSSPRSRTTDSWAVDPTSDPLPQKLRLMCSYGGHIVPRPHDKSLCYVGGDTRMIVVDRHSTTLSSLSSHLSKTLLNNRPFTLKYQLPNEDLDSLITVSTDEDLDNMIEEYDRTLSSHSSAHKPSRLRLFLFPLKPESSQSIEPLLDSSTKSDDWFLSALNGSGLLNRGFSDSAPVDCLLGLDDDLGMNNTDSGSRDADVNSNSLPGPFGNEKSGKHSQDVHSVPDSPMLETTSSFGSTSSSPSIANLPPVRVATEERLASDQKLGIEEQFAQMVMRSNSASGGGQKQVQEEGYVVMTSGAIPGNITLTGMPVGVAAGDYQSRVYSDDERSDHGVPIGYRKLPVVGQQTQQQQQPQQVQGQPPQVQSQQKSSAGLDFPSPDSVSSDGSLTNPLSRSKPVIYQEQVVQLPSGINRVSTNPVEQKINVSDPHAGLQLQPHIPEAGYVLQQPQADQRQPQQPQQQFIHAGTHYIHHATGSLPVAAYYHAYPSQHHPVHPHQLDQQYPVYYMPVSQAPAYNISAQQPNAGETTSAPGRPQTPPNPAMVPQTAAYNPVRNAPNSKPEMAANVYRMGAAGAPQLVQVPSSQHQQQQLYYTQQQQIHHQSQSVAPASGANATYAYEFTNPPHHQIYYTQPLAPTLPSQYQTINAANPIVLPDASGQIPTDNIKQQLRTSQPL